MNNEKNILKEVSNFVKNWEEISLSLGYNKHVFNDSFSFFQHLVWLFLKEIFGNRKNIDVIKYIEEVIPDVASPQILFADLKLENLKTENHDVDLGKEISKRVSEWQVFGRVLNFKEYRLKQLSKEFEKCQERTYCMMKEFCSPNKLNTSWKFWKNCLSKFDDGRSVIFELEINFPELIYQCGDLIYHSRMLNNNELLLFHQHVLNYNLSILPLSRKREIKVNIGGDGVKILHYKDYQEFIKAQVNYFNVYQIFDDMKTFDFSKRKNKPCEVLKSFDIYLQETNDKGFAYKGYSLKHHYRMFGDNSQCEEKISDNIFAYLSNDNVVIHLKFCNNITDISRTLNSFLADIEYCKSVHECLCNNSVIHIGIVVVDDVLFNDVDNFPCKLCVEKLFILPKSFLIDPNDFYDFYIKIIKHNKEMVQTKTKIIRSSQLSKSLKINILGFMALKDYNFPTFTSQPFYQINELKKLVSLTACQMTVYYSEENFILVRGGYGSGKSILLQQVFEQVIEYAPDDNVFYLICHDQMSKFTKQMNFYKKKYPNKFVVVCNSQGAYFFYLSDILKQVRHAWKGRRVHVFIDEFNGEFLNTNEVKKIKSELQYFNGCHIFIATQPMSYHKISENVDNIYVAEGFQYDLLISETDFKIYNLDYSLRCSVEINKFIEKSINVLADICVPSIDLNGLYKNEKGFIVDHEHILQKYSYICKENCLRKYYFNNPKYIGHNVCCGRVQITLLDINSAIECLKIILYDKLLRIIDKVVICTFSQEINSSVFGILQTSNFIWTNDVDEFLNSNVSILFTDHATIRGYEFDKMIFVFGLDQIHLNFRLIECFSRAIKNLFLIINPQNCFEKVSKDFDISGNYDHTNIFLSCWKFLHCVEWKEVVYENERNKYCLISKDGHQENLESKFTEKLSNIVQLADEKGYPWREVSKFSPRELEIADFLKEDFLNTAVSIIFANDDINLFNEYIYIHSIDVQNLKLHNQKTFLHWAAQHNAHKICEILIKVFDISPHLCDSKGDTPLHIAATYNSHMVAFVLLEQGIDPNILNFDSQTPLYYASVNNCEKVMKILFDFNADVNSKNKNSTPLNHTEDTTALHAACAEGCERAVLLLLNHQLINVNSKDSHGRTPLHEVSEKNFDIIAKLLLQKGADINSQDDDGDTPLSIACQCDNSKVAKVLISFGANVNCQDIYGNTPVHFSVDKFFKNVKLLLMNGGDPNAQNSSFDTPLHIACKCGSVDQIKLLVEYGGRIDVENDKGETPIDVAIDDERRRIILSYFVD